MACKIGPNRNQEGLVFHYDMDNQQKSWLGKPTINIINNVTPVSGMTGVTLTYIRDEGSYRKYSLSGIFTGGSYPYTIGLNPSAPFTGGVLYTSRITIKTNVEYKFNTFAVTGLSYVNAPLTDIGTNFSTRNSDGSLSIGRIGFSYTSTSTQIGYLFTNPINNTTFDPNTDFIWIKDFQIEQGSYPTPLVIGTRSNTQAIIDLTGNNAISASTISFNQDNTFYFNGTTDKISIVIPDKYKTVTNDTNRSWEVIAIPNSTLTAAGIFGTSYVEGCTYFCNGGIVIWGGTYRFGWYDGSSYLWLDSGVAATANVPVHIVATWNKADYKPRIYVNGILKAIYGSATNLNYYNIQGVYQIGYLSGAGNRFSGSIPVVRNYFNKALTDQEISLNYESYKSRYNFS